MVVELTEPAHFWTNPEGIKLACYEWLPKNKTPKFIIYICKYRGAANVQIILIFISAHGYSEHSSAYYRVVNRVLALGGAVISHDHYAHGRSGPHQADSIHRCQIYR